MIDIPWFGEEACTCDGVHYIIFYSVLEYYISFLRPVYGIMYARAEKCNIMIKTNALRSHTANDNQKRMKNNREINQYRALLTYYYINMYMCCVTVVRAQTGFDPL